MSSVEGLREYAVKVLTGNYIVFAHDRYGAASQGVRLFLKTHPGRSFTMLMSLVSARLVHPEPTGRKARYDNA